MIGILIAYGFATLIYLGVSWDRAYKHHLIHGSAKDQAEHQRLRRRAARMSLFFPLWLPFLCIEGVWWLIKMAWGKVNHPKVSKLLCPECRKEMQQGPHR
jgi:hypothetical protein